MKEIWINSKDEIEQEIARLAAGQVPITVSRPGSPPHVVKVLGLARKKSFDQLCFKKVGQFTPPEANCFFFYRPLPYLTRLFEGMPMNDEEQAFSVVVPPAIFQIPRRKYPRIATPAASQAFFVAGGTKINQAQILDVSLEGAFLVGRFSATVVEQSTIGPITFRLHTNNKYIEPIEIRVETAKVMRLIKAEDDIRKIGIHFQIAGDESANLENYIYIRSLEEGPANGKPE